MKTFHRLLVPVFLLLTATSWTQDAETTFKLNVNVDLVELHVTVADEKDRPIGGLKQENFTIYEDRDVQPIAVFKHEDIPVSLGLVIDNSRSIEPRKARLDAAALSFVRQSNTTDETFVVHFDFDARLAQDFTSNSEDLERTLAAVKPYGQTAIFDAVGLALNEMEKAKYPKKAILLITDGIDNASKTTLDQILERVKRNRVAIYCVGLLSESGGQAAENELIRIAEASGGRAYFPETVGQAQNMMERIARDLREQYTLGYFPTNGNRDGSWRSVRVQVSPPAGYPLKLTTNYRHGYYGPEK
jgi:Ca-activated chloride channel family protein